MRVLEASAVSQSITQKYQYKVKRSARVQDKVWTVGDYNVERSCFSLDKSFFAEEITLSVTCLRYVHFLTDVIYAMPLYSRR